MTEILSTDSTFCRGTDYADTVAEVLRGKTSNNSTVDVYDSRLVYRL